MLTRRTLLAASAAGVAATALSPRMAFAGAIGEKRLLTIVLRGAMDGLALAAPIADPAFARHRAKWVETYAGAPKLDGTFVLHPQLATVAKLYASGDAAVVHAVATGYRERSHFDAQNLLETGSSRPFERKDGFLNRLVGLVGADDLPAIALAATMPLALRGPNPSSTFAPSNLPAASEGLLQRLPGLYAEDAQLAQLWQQAETASGIADASDMHNLKRAENAGILAARMLRDPKGARLAMVDLAGWDTHANQLPMLATRFRQLDSLIAAFREGIGDVWQHTLVMVVTEFGRTVAINGTNGTDHGTAGAALLLGGGLRGKRVLADWPGLGAADLFEGRDLKPTLSLEALMGGAMSEHFGLDAARAMQTLFPGHDGRPLEGLIA